MGSNNTNSQELTDPIKNTADPANEKATDPFASLRTGTENPFLTLTSNSETRSSQIGAEAVVSPGDVTSASDEWDAAKTPPSRFQQRKGSVYATPGSRDSHIAKNIDRDAAYHAKLVEKGWAKEPRRGSK